MLVMSILSWRLLNAFCGTNPNKLEIRPSMSEPPFFFLLRPPTSDIATPSETRPRNGTNPRILYPRASGGTSQTHTSATAPTAPKRGWQCPCGAEKTHPVLLPVSIRSDPPFDHHLVCVSKAPITIGIFSPPPKEAHALHTAPTSSGHR